MMKYAILAALLTMTAPAVAEVPPSAPAVAAKFTVDMPIEAIAADPQAKAALEAVFPGMTTHAMYEQFKGMSLKSLQPMASDKITDDGIAKLAVELAAIK